MLFFSFVCHFSRILYSSSVAAGTSRAARSSWDWDPEKEHLLGPFSDSLQWHHSNVICSVMPLSLRTCNAFWPFEDCYLLGFVFAQFFFTAWSCLVWWYINMLFCKQSTLVSLETWVPCIPLLINSSPQVLVYKDNDRVIENLKIKKKKKKKFK